MKKLQWLKRDVISQDVKMTYLIRQGDSYYVIWCQLQDLAAMKHDDGKIYISQHIPMDIEMIAKEIHRPKKQIAKALDILEQLDLISRTEEGGIQLLNWDDIQDYDRQAKQREQNRQRVARHREKQAAMQSLVDDAHPVGNDAKNLVGDDLQSSREKNALSPAIARYQQYWGQVSSLIAGKLTELIEDWGDDAVATAIDIAKENNTNNVNYIKAILVNSNGQPKRKENSYEKWEKELDRSLDEVFCQTEQSRELRETKTHGGNLTGHDGTGRERTQNTLAPALQI